MDSEHRAATGNTPARAGLTERNRGIDSRDIETQRGRAGTSPANAAPRAAAVRVDRTVVRRVGRARVTLGRRFFSRIMVKNKGGTPAPPPTARPLVLVDSGSRLTHRLRIADAGEGGHDGPAAPRVRCPRGTLGAEVYLALVAPRESPPVDPRSYRFVRTVTGGSADVTFEPDQGGRSAAYLVRWVSATGEPGPWSETVTATVAA